MILAKKIGLKPNKNQEILLWQSVGTARYIYIYNWTLARQQENYKNGGKLLSDNELRKEITQLKKTELNWLNLVSNNVAKQAVKDACSSYINFFKRKLNFLNLKVEKNLNLVSIMILINLK